MIKEIIKLFIVLVKKVINTINVKKKIIVNQKKGSLDFCVNIMRINFYKLIYLFSIRFDCIFLYSLKEKIKKKYILN